MCVVKIIYLIYYKYYIIIILCCTLYCYTLKIINFQPSTATDGSFKTLTALRSWTMVPPDGVTSECRIQVLLETQTLSLGQSLACI